MAQHVLAPINDLWKMKNARRYQVAVVGLLLGASRKTDNTNQRGCFIPGFVSSGRHSRSRLTRIGSSKRNEDMNWNWMKTNRMMETNTIICPEEVHYD